jgi:hypothetical protein
MQTLFEKDNMRRTRLRKIKSNYSVVFERERKYGQDSLHLKKQTFQQRPAHRIYGGSPSTLPSTPRTKNESRPTEEKPLENVSLREPTGARRQRAQRTSPCGSCPRLSACASARPGRPLGSPRTFLPWHRPNAGSGLTQTPGSARATAPAGTRSSAPGAGAACRRSTFLLRDPDRKGENQEGYGDHGAHGATSSALTSASA